MKRLTYYAIYPTTTDVEECLQTIEREHCFYPTERLALALRGSEEKLFRVRIEIEEMALGSTPNEYDPDRDEVAHA